MCYFSPFTFFLPFLSLFFSKTRVLCKRLQCSFLFSFSLSISLFQLACFWLVLSFLFSFLFYFLYPFVFTFGPVHTFCIQDQSLQLLYFATISFFSVRRNFLNTHNGCTITRHTTRWWWFTCAMPAFWPLHTFNFLSFTLVWPVMIAGKLVYIAVCSVCLSIFTQLLYFPLFPFSLSLIYSFLAILNIYLSIFSFSLIWS